MSFNIELFPIEKFILNREIYAHKKEGEFELLEEHLDKTLKYLKVICSEKGLFSLISKFWTGSEEGREFYTELWVNMIYLHDIGKINPAFQAVKMNNPRVNLDKRLDKTTHSDFSAYIYFNYYIKKLLSNKDLKKDSQLLLLFILFNSYIISRHHSKLDNVINIIEKIEEIYSLEDLENYLQELEPNFKEKIMGLKIEKAFVKNLYKQLEKEKLEIAMDKKDWDLLEIYIYVKFMYGLLVSCDFYATYEYVNNKEIKELNLLKNIEEYITSFNNNEKIQRIHKHKVTRNEFEKNDINYYRTELFLEAEENLLKNINDNIFYLEAPTGAGKTLTSINLALKFLDKNRDLNKIFYVFPFNTLVEQTSGSLYEFFPREKIGIINSITPMDKIYQEEDGRVQIDYESTLLSRQFINYPIVLTTNVHLFENLFGLDRESSFALSHLANSVVILDEIQSYKNKIWAEIMEFLTRYSKLLNIKVIIMSATLPDLSYLLDTNEIKVIRLIENREKYYSASVFKDRVSLDFSFLKMEEEKEEILNLIKEKIYEERENRKILVEFINKKTAVDFYREMLEEGVVEKENLFLLTGDDNILERKRIIGEVKNNRKEMILISTQVVEAGVDIDMDIGFKDISLLDSEEQFLGRINRSCKKKGCKVYFFNIDRANVVYREDIRVQEDKTLINDICKEILINKDFGQYYRNVLVELKKENNSNKIGGMKEFIENKYLLLDFIEINKRLKLINNDIKTQTIFFSRDIELENGDILKGEKIWNEFKDIIMNRKMNYSKRRVKMADIMEKFMLFSYNLPIRLTQNIIYNDCIGDSIKKIENWEDFFIGEKLDRSKFEQNEDFSFIV